MYSIVLLAAMSASPEVPQDFLCPVSPSNYGHTFWSNHNFYECCAPAKYGAVTCWNNGYGNYPGGAHSFYGCAPINYGPFYHPSSCSTGSRDCGSGVCGYGWDIGHTPAGGCGFPPYARGRHCDPCGAGLQYAFDTGLCGLSSGAGYAGFGGAGNFGMYGLASMQHPIASFDLPRSKTPPHPIPQGALPAPSNDFPESLIPKAAEFPTVPPAPSDKDQKKDEPKKESPGTMAHATVVLNVPEGAQVWVEDILLKSTMRSFLTPPLEIERDYRYTVRVVLNGVEEVKTITVRAKNTSDVAFEKFGNKAATVLASDR